MPAIQLSCVFFLSCSLFTFESCWGHTYRTEDEEQEYSSHVGEGSWSGQFWAAHSSCVILKETQYFYGE